MSITKISPSVVDFDDSITISTADNTSQLILTSTDADANAGPVLELYRNSSSPADNDELGRIYFYGENDNDEKIEYGLIRGTIVDASDSAEGSALQFYTYSTGGQKSRLELLEGETVFNEGSSDIDFRVESDGDANMLVVDGGNNRVGVGTSPDYRMHIFTSDSSADAHANADDLFIESSGNSGLTIGSGTSSTGNVFFSDSGSTLSGQIEYRHSDDSLMIVTGGSNRLHIQSDGDLDIIDGNLVVASGHGINFAAHANASGMSSELLDDYEEGTYTPAMFGVTTAGSVAYSSTAAGWYTKVGRIVVAYFDLPVSSASGMAGTTAITLPVQSANINAYMGVTYWDVDDNYFDDGKGAAGYVYPNTARIELYQTTNGAKGHDIGNTFKSNQTGRISGSVTYFSAT